MRGHEEDMKTGEGLERLVDLMARLRGPDGCPWDRKQTLRTLRPFILEEAHELVEAIDTERIESIQEELGDLLLEVLFVSQICTERSHFTLVDVMRELEDKLVRRHPHVFRSDKARDSEEALARWEEIKDAEKSESGDQPSPFRDMPRVLPALSRANKLSSRAAREGFDWRSADDVLEKLHEELGELEEARADSDPAAIEEELGDLLFATANLARHLGVDPEVALQSTNRKFTERFLRVKEQLEAQGRSFEESSMEEMEVLWQKAKEK
jgi:MazG family protein